MLRPLFLAAVAFLAACAASPPPRTRTARRRPRAASTAAATTPTPSRSTAPTSFYTPAPPASAGSPSASTTSRLTVALEGAERCASLHQHNAAMLERAASHGPCAGAGLTALREAWDQCVTAPGGTWATEITDLRVDGDRDELCAVELRWRLAFFRTRDGAVETDDAGRVERTARVVSGGDEVQTRTTLTLTASDLDNDRIPEAAVVAQSEDRGTGHAHQSVEVYTAAGGAVRVFEPTRAMNLVGADDVDDDGRVDLFVPSPYTWTEGTECGRSVIHEPLTLLAHALPGGGFSTTDAVAARHLRAVCPGPDAEPVPPRGANDPAGLGVICRRLWGMSPDEALAPLRCARFRQEPSMACEHTTRRLPPLEQGECPAQYETWAHLAAPVQLR